MFLRCSGFCCSVWNGIIWVNLFLGYVQHKAHSAASSKSQWRPHKKQREWEEAWGSIYFTTAAVAYFPLIWEWNSSLELLFFKDREENFYKLLNQTSKAHQEYGTHSDVSSSHVLYPSKEEEASPAKQMFYIELEGSKCLMKVSDKQKETGEGDRRLSHKCCFCFKDEWQTKNFLLFIMYDKNI